MQTRNGEGTTGLGLNPASPAPSCVTCGDTSWGLSFLICITCCQSPSLLRRCWGRGSWNSQQRPGGFRKVTPPIPREGPQPPPHDPLWAAAQQSWPSLRRGRADTSGPGSRSSDREGPSPCPSPFLRASRFLPSARTVVFFLNLAWPRVITGTAGRKAGARRLGLPGASPRTGKAGDQLHQAGAPPRQSHHTSVMRCLQQTFV